MKKIFAITFIASAFAACNNSNSESATASDTVVTTTEPVAPASVAARTPAEGDVLYENGRVQVYRNGAWVEADDDIKYDNGIVVYRDGRAMKDGTEVELEEGYTVDREGNVWDKTGNAIGDAWDATKHGVKKAGQAVGHAAEKVGEKVKDAVH